MILELLEMLMSCMCLISYPILIYLVYYLIRYDINKEYLKQLMSGLLIPMSLLIIPTISTEYSVITNFVKTINPYMLVLLLILNIPIMYKIAYKK